MLRFAALADEDSEQVRHVRGTILAVAQDWYKRLPDGEIKDLAIKQLGDAGDLAAGAYSN